MPRVFNHAHVPSRPHAASAAGISYHAGKVVAATAAATTRGGHGPKAGGIIVYTVKCIISSTDMDSHLRFKPPSGANPGRVVPETNRDLHPKRGKGDVES